MQSIKNKNILSLIGLGLGFRLLIFFVFYTNVTFFPDSFGYIELAEILQDFNLSGYSGKRSPGYPLLILLGFENLYLVVFFQFLLGVIGSIYWYRTLLMLQFSTRISWWITIFMSTLLHVVFLETAILVESLVLFLFSIVVFLLVRTHFQGSKLKNELQIGLLLGLLTLIKPFYAFIPFVLYGLYLLRDLRLRRIINKRLLIIIFPLLAYFGWSYVNKINTGYFVSTTFFGLNTAQNVVRFAEKAPGEYSWITMPYVEYREKSKEEGKDIAMSIWYAYNEGAFEEHNLSFNELSAELGDFAMVTIRENPWEYLRQVFFFSWVDFWKPSIYWNYDQFNFRYANKIFLALWYAQYVLLLFFRLFFLVLIPYHIFRAIKYREVNISFNLTMLVFSASVLQALVTYGSNSRFSFPFEFMMIFVVLLFLKDKVFFTQGRKVETVGIVPRKNNTFG